ncbi:MAG: LapA family protein [Pseudomonadota bacterium]
MQIVRTIIWVLILFGILAFSFFNWDTVEVTLWDNLVLETKIPALVIIAFVLGLAPMWLYHRSVKWSLNRRIRSLENSVKSNALSQRHEPPVSKPADKPVEKLESTVGTLSPATSEKAGDGGE